MVFPKSLLERTPANRQDRAAHFASTELSRVIINVRVSSRDVWQLCCMRRAITFRLISGATDPAHTSASERLKDDIVRIIVIEWRTKKSPNDRSIGCRSHRGRSVDVCGREIIVDVGTLRSREINVE